MRQINYFLMGTVILLIISSLVSIASASTVKIISDADTALFETTPDANCDTVHNTMWIASWDGSRNRRILVHFDLSSLPAGAMISSAAINLHRYSRSGDRINNVHRVSEEWVESIVTWNTQPGFLSTETTSSSTGPDPIAWVTFDVTPDVQDFVDGTPNFGWLIKEPVESLSSAPQYAAYHTREWSDTALRPYLEVTYTEGSPAPVAAFSGTPLSGTAPLTVNFTDGSTGTPTSWSWDFNNDGTSDSTEQNTSHEYTTAGTYTVKLTATNAGGSDDEVKTNYITVTEAPVIPVAAFTATPSSGAAPLSVQFTDESTGTPISWAWDFNNDGTVDSTEQNPSYIFATDGTYTVKLMVTGQGWSDEVTMDITVGEPIATPEFPTLALPVMLIGAMAIMAYVYRRE